MDNKISPEGEQGFKMHENRGPRFRQGLVLPEAPDGYMLVKFHGEPAIIPEFRPGDEMVGKTEFTKRQIEKLIELENERRAKDNPVGPTIPQRARALELTEEQQKNIFPPDDNMLVRLPGFGTSTIEKRKLGRRGMGFGNR